MPPYLPHDPEQQKVWQEQWKKPQEVFLLSTQEEENALSILENAGLHVVQPDLCSAYNLLTSAEVGSGALRPLTELTAPGNFEDSFHLAHMLCDADQKPRISRIEILESERRFTSESQVEEIYDPMQKTYADP